ncbi:hypothetical protein PoB_006812800 [Plakobranchus ocellatus]|uniref:Peptidase S1 domain-containing protein n=1 Tax=Plakobranchus ocellatus TaxID=259542 RepID=A0AAV4DBH9_9GAST|nr:hypothetical protein PoB_006812800 [Plakobranchus ocellatus]
MLSLRSRDATSSEGQQESEDDAAMVIRKKRDQGNHECEVFGQGCEAAEASRNWNSCTKNPGHERFIPVSAFCIDDLPEDYRKQPLFDALKSFSDSIVRLRVSHTSEERPEGYPFHNSSRTNVSHSGSGWLSHIDIGVGDCKCVECSTNNVAPRQKWCVVEVITACHVVYNSEEAKATMVDFFYDDKESRTDGRMKTLTAHCVLHRDINGDLCFIRCATHDDILKEQLRTILRTKHQFIAKRAPRSSKPREIGACLVFSHPHGQPKHITVGHERFASPNTLDNPYDAKYAYTTDTCPGSSGGLVIIINQRSPIMRLGSAVHSSGYNGSHNESCKATIDGMHLNMHFVSGKTP